MKTMKAPSRQRWERLVQDLADAGVDARLDAHTYPGGIRYGIQLRFGDTLVNVIDQWWRKNNDVWIGWNVYTDDAKTALVIREWPNTKKRSQVVAAVLEAQDRKVTR